MVRKVEKSECLAHLTKAMNFFLTNIRVIATQVFHRNRELVSRNCWGICDNHYNECSIWGCRETICECAEVSVQIDRRFDLCMKQVVFSLYISTSKKECLVAQKPRPFQ